MSDELSVFQINGLVAFIVSLIVTRLLITAHLNDAPTDSRKLHSFNVATAGGVAIIAGLCAAIFNLNAKIGIIPDNQIIFVLGTALLFGFIGLADDILTLKSTIRFAIMIIGAGLLLRPEWVVQTIPIFEGFKLPIGGIIGFIGSLFWIILMVNAVNFIDGANGVAFGTISVSFIGLGALCFFHGEMAGMAVSFLATASIWGFLTYNIGKGNIFAGDVGSWFIGALFACLSLVAVRSGVNIFAIGLLALPILADVILTIFHRIKLRQNILTPHNLHIYQRIIKSGKSHIYVALLWWIQAQICVALAIIGDKFWQNNVAIIFVAVALLYAAIFHILRPKLQAKIDAIA